MLKAKEVDSLILFRNNSPEIKSDLWLQKGEGVYNDNRFKFLSRLSGILRQKKISVFIGIYEIPHGLIALIVAIIKQKPSIVSIIGNPKYSIRNNGFRGVVTNWIYKRASILTVTGNQSKKFLVEHKGIVENKIYVLPNSIPVDEFINDKNQLAPKKYDLVTIGRLSSEKGLLNLIGIIAILRKQTPKIRLGIAGKGPQMEELKEKVQEHNLEENIDLLGYVESASEFLRNGKIFISTSYTEGLPRTAIQSMLGGLPVVASNVGDMSDLVINEKTGVLIEDPNDKMSFVNGINMILNDDSKFNIFSENAINYAKKYYSHKAATKVWNDVFSDLKI